MTVPPLAASAYVLGVGALATWGFATGSTAVILVAAVLALPASVPAVVGYYLAYGLLALVPAANPSSSSGSGWCGASGACHGSATGDPAAWFALATDVVGVLALVAAAVVNVMLWRLLTRRRARAGAAGPQ